MEIEKLVKKMMVEDPFYGFMLTTINREYSDRIPTLAVTANANMTIKMLINKEFYESLNDKEQMAVLKHELLHVAFKHLLHWKEFPSANKQALRYAHDLEVNCYVQNLPAGAVVCSVYGFPEKKGTVWYYKELMKLGQQDDSMFPSADDHSMWNEVDEVSQEIIRCAIDDTLRRSAASVKNRGTIPAELVDIINGLDKIAPPVYDWKKAFRRFLGNSYSERKKSSRRKESRRFEGSAGQKHLKRSTVLTAIDTSGSVSDDELCEFISELTHMHKSGAVIHVIEFDAVIQRKYAFKPHCIKEVKGRGGTNFGPVIEYYLKHFSQYDTLVMFTDGEAPINYHVPQDNILWVISSAGAKKDYPGKAIYIPKNNNNTNNQ